MSELSKKGQGREEILSKLEQYRADDLAWRDGHCFAYVYDAGREAERIGREVMGMFSMENGLDPTTFPSFKRLENDLMGISAAHLRGEGAAGTFTSGGTESIILAVKTARDRARALRPEIAAPEMVLAETAHAAFHKAAAYLGVKAVMTKVDPVTFKADLAATRAAIGPNTILLVGSAPSYAHGVIDPIRGLGQIALEHDLLLHVDGCVGGWLLPFMRRNGEEVPDFDFTVPGVTSISMDFHKYAFTPKGASVVLYKDKALRAYQFFACSNWTGYTVVNAAVQSSKSGSALAAAWAVINHLGDEGYLKHAAEVRKATLRLAEGINAIDGLSVMAPPEMCMFAFKAEGVSVFHIIDEMKERGWLIQPQMRFGDIPENIHMSVHPANVEWVEPFLADLADAVEAARGLPSGQLAAMIQDQLASIDVSTLGPEQFSAFMAMAGAGEGLPVRMAPIQEVMNILPSALSEALLINFFNDLFTP